MRLDAQLSSQTRMTVRGSKFIFWLPYDPRYTGGATVSPSSAESQDRHSTNLLVTLTQVVNNRALNELKVGTQGHLLDHRRICQLAGSPARSNRQRRAPHQAARILDRDHAYDDAAAQWPGRLLHSRRLHLFVQQGRAPHDEAGGEYIYQVHFLGSCHPCVDTYDAQGGPVPANIEDLFPDILDASTWNLAPLRSITRSFQIGVGAYMKQIPRHVYAGWVQDDWQMGRLTVNLGLRYDFGSLVYAENVAVEPWLQAGRSQDTNNYSPRLGFAFSVNDRTVVRGGYGDVLRRSLGSAGPLHADAERRGDHSGGKRWPGRLHDEPVRWAGPDIGAVLRAHLPHGGRARVLPADDRLGDGESGRRDPLQPPGVDRCATTAPRTRWRSRRITFSTAHDTISATRTST